MQFTIVTGLSGSGKTKTLKYLEDLGYFCADNILPGLIPKFSELLSSQNSKIEKVALGIDMRVGEKINELLENIEMLKKSGFSTTLLFIDAKDEVLIKRYKETRHQHPVESDDGLVGSILLERKMLEKIYHEADVVIDTTNLELYELQKEIKKISKQDEEDGFLVNIIPFGFKYGLPMDADMVFDVRCFPNPFYITELKTKTGNDKEVSDYVMSFSDVQKFFLNLTTMILDLLPLYREEGKKSLSIAIGCTGGKHRSVTIANKLGEELTNKNYKVNMIQREIEKGR